MMNTKKGQLLQEGEINPDLLAFSERTEWQERMIQTKAKSFALRVMIIGGMIALCICAYRANNIDEIVKTIAPIISGVLSFFAGRLTRR